MFALKTLSALFTYSLVLIVLLPSAVLNDQESPAASPTDDGSVISLDTGDVRGEVADEVLKFRGIPYAAPPVGELRWAPPQSAEAWQGVRDAVESGPACAQPATDDNATSQSREDCLYLDVTLPAQQGDSPRPVMVWLHGGGFTSGAGSEYDPTRLALEGDVIVVTVDFRLGVFSGMALPDMDHPGTYGLQDQQAALQWVQRNAEAFGGDPGNVTLFGESGGAIAVCGHLTSPESNGLFQKAILQSGSCGTLLLANSGAPGFPQTEFWRELDRSVAMTRDAAQVLGCEPDAASAELLACLRDQPAENLLQFTLQFNPMAYGGDILPHGPARVAEDGDLAAVPVISGHTKNEALAFSNVFSISEMPITDDNLQELLVQGFGNTAVDVEREYPRDAYPTAAETWAAPYTDAIFACPQARMNDSLAGNAPVFAYEFADESALPLIPAVPGDPSGPSHGAELPYLFDMPDTPVTFEHGVVPLDDTQMAVASDMIEAWSSFAWDGVPVVDGEEWPEWSADEHVARQITAMPGSTETVNPFESHHCGFWAETPLPPTAPVPIGTPSATPAGAPDA